MAQKRMFNKSVTNSSLFLKMPATSRLLYYDLGMNADDDGFVEHFMVLRMTGATQQDLGVLELNGLVKIFDENVLWIRDWKENNYIPKDRYKPSKYLSIYDLNTLCIQDVYTNVYTDKNRLDKNSIDKNSIDKNSIDNIYNQKQSFDFEFDNIWKLYPRKQGKQNALKSYIKARKKGITNEQILDGLNNYINYIKLERIEDRYIKQGSTWFNQECWNDDYSTKREVTTKDLQNHYDFSEFMEEK